MFLKCDPYRVWCSIFYSKLVNCILLRSLFVFVKGRGTCGSGERNVKIWIDFRKSPRFSLTSPLSQKRKREVKSPCFYYVWYGSTYHYYSCEFQSHSLWGVLDKTLCDQVCQWLAADLWFSPGTSVSSTNKTDRHNITEILLKVALNPIIQI
jgi:hypothetical protein